MLRSKGLFSTLLIGSLLILVSCDAGTSIGPDSGTSDSDAIASTDKGHGAPGQAADKKATVYRAELDPLNRSGVEGVAKIQVQKGTFTVQVNANGHVPGEVHPQHIHGKTDKNEVSTCPTAEADDDGDGFVEVGEGGPSYGPVFIPLDGSLDEAEGVGQLETFPVPNNQGGAITYRQSTGLDELATNFEAPLSLENRTIVLHGENVPDDVIDDGEGGYLPTLPVACGTIEQVN